METLQETLARLASGENKEFYWTPPPLSSPKFGSGSLRPLPTVRTPRLRPGALQVQTPDPRGRPQPSAPHTPGLGGLGPGSGGARPRVRAGPQPYGGVWGPAGRPPHHAGKKGKGVSAPLSGGRATAEPRLLHAQKEGPAAGQRPPPDPRRWGRSNRGGAGP